MSFAKVYSAQTSTLHPQVVSVEVDISKGLNAFSIVGLGDKAVEESRDRVSAAVKNSGFTSPKSKNHKVVISLAPANIKKEGASFDVGMALSYLKASKEILFQSEKNMFAGELSLDGELRPVHGILSLVRLAKKKGFQNVFVPHENRTEAALIKDINIYGAKTLIQLINHLDKRRESHKLIEIQPETDFTSKETPNALGFGDIRGQQNAKRGLLIAASGGHNILLYGPPGTGKTMLARAFRNILPPLSYKEALETTAIHSVSGTLRSVFMNRPPFRSPHNSASHVSILGGGANPKPGEVTLSHRGVLFLDEFPEFERRVIDGLRQPLEDRYITIARAQGTASFPAKFILVAAMNPCPCGNFGSEKECVCLPNKREAYRKKISGPIIDRIDMWIEVPHIDIKLLSAPTIEDTETAIVRSKVADARDVQKKRFSGKSISINSEMNVRDLDLFSNLKDKAKEVLQFASTKLDLSPRSYHRIIKLARTIADLDNKEHIEEAHILEALQYRPKKLQ